jgi:hypothetical protein
MSFYQMMPSFSEAFSRLAQTREKGCLMVYNAQEAVHLFVHNGKVVGATGGKQEGEGLIEHVFQMKGTSYGWMPGAEPEKKNVNVDMQEYLHKHASTADTRFGKTLRIPNPADRLQKKAEGGTYFFIPEESPTFKLKVKKATNVVGREGTCDVYVESGQVSRKHCLLQVTERGLLVRDLESTNGTFVNGIPMTEGYINVGDRLSLGTYVLTLHRDKA